LERVYDPALSLPYSLDEHYSGFMDHVSPQAFCVLYETSNNELFIIHTHTHTTVICKLFCSFLIIGFNVA